MFTRTFIELLKIFNKLNNYSSNILANNSLLYSNTFDTNLYTVDEYLHILYIYNDFIKYYEVWYTTYFTKILI